MKIRGVDMWREGDDLCFEMETGSVIRLHEVEIDVPEPDTIIARPQSVSFTTDLAPSDTSVDWGALLLEVQHNSHVRAYRRWTGGG